MVPVDHVAAVTAVAGITKAPGVQVTHIAARPPVTYNDIFLALSDYGYGVSSCEYLVWRQRLEQHVLEVQDNALFPLLHFVLDDLPRNTRAPELDDKNAQELLKFTGTTTPKQTVDEEVMGRYLAWLVNAGFLDQPDESSRLKLPILSGEAKAVGRSGQ